MKSLIAALLLAPLISFSAESDVTKFECATAKVIEGKKQSTFSFKVSNLNSPGEQVGYWTKDDDQEPVKMSPKNSIMDLNDNWTIRMEDKGLTLTSDGDGCQFTTVQLYKDAKFKIGYVAIKDGGCGATGVPAYSIVRCNTSKSE